MNTFSARIMARTFLLAVILFSTQQVFSWGVTGHRVVAEVAQQHLSKRAKKEIEKLIGRESLAWWANWPDFIKSDSTWNDASKWHYVDLPGHIGKDSFVAALKKLPGKNLYTQIQDMMRQLRDKDLPIEQRKIALYFLIHFMGDLHQPLHVGRDEDQGGNKVVVYWFDKKTNLHSVWDSELINFQQYSFTEYARLIDIAQKEQVKEWQSSSLEDWFYESHTLADSIYEASPNESKLSYKYNFKFQHTLDGQLLKGGIRLAAVLNEVFQ